MLTFMDVMIVTGNFQHVLYLTRIMSVLVGTSRFLATSGKAWQRIIASKGYYSHICERHDHVMTMMHFRCIVMSEAVSGFWSLKSYEKCHLV